jgi:phage-related minor tail protein
MNISPRYREKGYNGAARVAVESYADALKSRSSLIQENLGTIETLWKNIKDAAGAAWDQMLNVGRRYHLSRLCQVLRSASKLKNLHLKH